MLDCTREGTAGAQLWGAGGAGHAGHPGVPPAPPRAHHAGPRRGHAEHWCCCCAPPPPPPPRGVTLALACTTMAADSRRPQWHSICSLAEQRALAPMGCTLSSKICCAIDWFCASSGRWCRMSEWLVSETVFDGSSPCLACHSKERPLQAPGIHSTLSTRWASPARASSRPLTSTSTTMPVPPPPSPGRSQAHRPGFALRRREQNLPCCLRAPSSHRATGLADLQE